MRMNWLQRTIREYKHIKFHVEQKDYRFMDQLHHSINYYRSRENDDSDTYHEIKLSSITSLFITSEIDRVLESGFKPFAKTFFHHLEENRHMGRQTSYVQAYGYFHTSEMKAIHDLTAMMNEHLEDEYLLHSQTFYQITSNDLLRFFIKISCEKYRNIPVSKMSYLLSSSSV